MSPDAANIRVAVLGLGIAGVGTLKNLVEAGFDAVGFERNEYIGGLWQWTSNKNITSATKSTKSNITKQCSCYQDFPYPDDLPDYPFAADNAKYIEDYANHFDLLRRCRLGVTVDRLERSGDHWAVKISRKSQDAGVCEEMEHFDKVIVTSGAFSKAFLPTYPGVESYKGQILHVQGFKNPEEFRDKRVVVVGLCNSGTDCCIDLVGVAEKIYISHRSGCRVMQREHNGRPVDHTITRRKLLLSQTFATYFPGIASKVGAFALEKRMKKAFPDIDPSWNLLPAPALLNGGVLISDELIPLLKKGSIVSVPGIKRFAPNGPSSIEFSDGTVLESIDAVVFATGYYFDYGFLSPEADPTTFPAREFNNAPHANGLVYPRLYQGLLSTKYPSSLAFMGPFRGHSFTAFSNADLSSQAISQLWLGNYPMPSSAEMEAWCDANYASSLWQIKNWHIQKIGTSPLFLERWCNQVAGNGVDFMLSWTSWEAWKFWWEERELYKLLMDGINTPYLFRLFESPRGNKGRKRWPGAREAIYKANGKVYSGKTE